MGLENYWMFEIDTHDATGKKYPEQVLTIIKCQLKYDAINGLRKKIEADGKIFDPTKIIEIEKPPMPTNHGLKLSWVLKYEE